jgi:MFS family permease
VLEHVGVFLGPALAGLLMHGGDPARVFAVMGVAMAVCALAVTRLGIDRAIVAPVDVVEASDVAGEALAGFRALRRAADVRLVVVVLSVSTLIIGANDVLFVAVADDLSGADSAGRAGLFGAAYGLGALLAALASVVLVGRARLATALAAAAIAAGAALALLGSAGEVVLACVLFALCGTGESMSKITGATLIQRIAPGAVLSRIFGIVEGLAMAAMALGAVAVAALVDRFGLTTGTVLLGVLIVAVVTAQSPRLWALDRRTPTPRAALVDLVRGQEMFALLPAPALERLVASIEPREVAAGTVVTNEGDVGDRFYIVESGTFAVAVGGHTARTLRAGGSFGEIALLRDVPRTATVTATTDGLLQTLQRDDFLAALRGHPGLRVAHARSAALLAEDASRDGGAAG